MLQTMLGICDGGSHYATYIWRDVRCQTSTIKMDLRILRIYEEFKYLNDVCVWLKYYLLFPQLNKICLNQMQSTILSEEFSTSSASFPQEVRVSPYPSSIPKRSTLLPSLIIMNTSSKLVQRTTKTAVGKRFLLKLKLKLVRYFKNSIEQ